MASEVVPFGKYKGQPVEVLRADEDYCQWLMGQDWFRSRFGNIYQTIINYGAEPQDTPEHNELQASFLDDERCFRLARLLYPNRPFDREAARRVGPKAVALYQEFKEHLQFVYEDAWISGRKFEAAGWDVIYNVEAAALMFAVRSLPECSCACDHETDCSSSAPCRGGEKDWHCEHRHSGERIIPTLEWWSAFSTQERRAKAHGGWYRVYQSHCSKTCPWGDREKTDWLLGDADTERLYQPSSIGTVLVECKPALGDDFPTVLRQVKGYKYEHGDRRCVIARRASFEKVTWEQVASMFAASGIVLLREAQLLTEAIPPPDRSKEG